MNCFAEESNSFASDLEVRNGTVYGNFDASYYTCILDYQNQDPADLMMYTSDDHVFTFLFLFKQGTLRIPEISKR